MNHSLKFFALTLLCFVVSNTVVSAAPAEETTGKKKILAPWEKKPAETLRTPMPGDPKYKEPIKPVQLDPPANADPLPPGGTDTVVDNRPQNTLPSNNMCETGYYCVVPHGQIILATCMLGPGNQNCSQVNDKCNGYRQRRSAGEQLNATEQAEYDRICKT